MGIYYAIYVIDGLLMAVLYLDQFALESGKLYDLMNGQTLEGITLVFRRFSLLVNVY